jgi:hypothetical protein
MVTVHNDVVGNGGKRERIGQGNLHKNGGNVMIAIGAFPMDGKSKVDFCWRLAGKHICHIGTEECGGFASGVYSNSTRSVPTGTRI